MKATELMIGDWVLWKNRNVQIVRTCALVYSFGHRDVWLAHCNDDNNVECHDMSTISPIPLTPEILEKNRFLPSFEMGHETLCLVSPEYSVYYRPVDTYLYVFKRDNEQGEGDFIVSDHRNKNAKYVHELQHALRLCGLDELADNFKI